MIEEEEDNDDDNDESWNENQKSQSVYTWCNVQKMLCCERIAENKENITLYLHSPLVSQPYRHFPWIFQQSYQIQHCELEVSEWSESQTTRAAVRGWLEVGCPSSPLWLVGCIWLSVEVRTALINSVRCMPGRSKLLYFVCLRPQNLKPYLHSSSRTWCLFDSCMRHRDNAHPSFNLYFR